ncbi:MAG: NAD(P)-dependent oxidoreductase [Bacteroidota bacterium]
MTDRHKILVTGAAGYVGAVLCRQLLTAGFAVRGLDRLLFGGASLVELAPSDHFEFVKGDLRDATRVTRCLGDVHAVVHLAAIVGDPACQKFPEEASEVMDTATVTLYQRCQAAGVKHFVFASTTSNYGVMEGEQLLGENAPLNPQSHYARLKVGFERYLLDHPVPGMAATILRFATAYGFSPRVRFDLSVNHFTRDLSLGRELLIFGEKLWRPYCHVRDLARSVVKVLEAGPGPMHSKVYNVGDSQENYTKEMIVRAISEIAPQGKVKYGTGPAADVRNYRVDFSRIQRELNFTLTRRVPEGIRELNRLVTSGLIADPDAATYRNT